MDFSNNNDLLEQLRNDYSSIKAQLDKQEIINDRLLRKTFETKVKSIHSVAWISSIAGLFVVLISPLVFHYNPTMRLSWAFVAGTDVMMLVCITFNYLFHKNVRSPKAGDDLLTFAKNAKKLKADYQGWLKYAVLMLTVWAGWMITEILMKSDRGAHSYIMIVGLLVGLIIGGTVGYKMDRKVMNQCDELIESIEEI